MQAVFKTNTREHWLALLLAEDVPSAPLNDFDDVFNDPQVKHLKMRVEVPHKRMGSVSLVRNGLRMSETPLEIHAPSPELGEHNEDVLGALGRAK